MLRPRTAAALFLLAAGCGPRIDRLTMEPVIIRVGPGGEATTESPDPELDAIVALQEAGDCTAAIPRLKRFAEEFPESARFPEAVFRLGLCHENEGDHRSARSYYRYVSARVGGDLGVEAGLRAAYTLESLGKPGDAAAEYGAIASRKGVAADVVAGARLRGAICLFRQGKAKKGRRALPEAIRLYSILPTPSSEVRASAAEARFADAEDRAAAFRKIRLEYPQKKLEQRLARKLLLLAETRDAYASVVQIKDPEWAAAAVYRIGEIYERFYTDLLGVPMPGNLTGTQQAIYAEQVAARAKPLQQQAFDSYLQVVTLGERVGLESAWVQKAQDRVRELEPELQKTVLPPGVHMPDDSGPADDDP